MGVNANNQQNHKLGKIDSFELWSVILVHPYANSEVQYYNCNKNLLSKNKTKVIMK